MSDTRKSSLTPQRLPERGNGVERQLATNRKKLKPRYPASGSRAARAEPSGHHWSVSVETDFSTRLLL